MKRDLPYIKELLIQVEAEDYNYTIDISTSPEDAKKQRHLELLVQSGYLSSPYHHAYELTWAGHDYLDNLRDPCSVPAPNFYEQK